jgi:[ribosomal protein S5]-alanine N-acetyltransferase
MAMPGLRTEHSLFSLRQWRDGDESSLALNANNRNIWINLRDAFPHPYTLKNAALWIQLSKDSTTNFAIDVEGYAVGDIGITLQSDLFRRSAEIGFWLGEAYWGRGIMTEAVRDIAEYAFDRFEIERIYAWILEYNTASARVLEKNGFVLEARCRRALTKEDRLFDQLIYAKLR